MTSAATLLYLIGFPLAGVALAESAALASWRSAMSAGAPNPPEMAQGLRSRLRIFLVYPATLAVFALVVLELGLGRGSGVVPDELLGSAAIAYGVPALMAGVGYAIIYSDGAAGTVKRPEIFPKVLIFLALVEVAAVFGLIVSIQILGKAGFPGAAELKLIDASRRAALFMAAGGIGAPLGALVARATWDFATPDRWPRSVLWSALSAEGPYVAGLVLSVLALGETR